jgi:hypothetical protein
MHKMKTVRQKQKFVGLVAIRSGFEVLICAGIQGDNDVEAFTSRFLDVESGYSVFD